MTTDERTEAEAIANRLLDEPYADPDDDIRVLARQFNRSQEQIEHLRAKFHNLHERLKDVLAGLETA